MNQGAGKTVIVTGATGFIAREAARAASARGWTVLLGCRNLAAGRAVADELRRSTGGDVRVDALDLGDLRTVVRFVGRVVEDRSSGKLPPLGGVILKAATQYLTGTPRTPQGVEATYAATHLGHAALVRGLLPVLDEGAAVVATVTHSAVPSGRPDPVGTWGYRAYDVDPYGIVGTEGRGLLRGMPAAVRGARYFASAKLHQARLAAWCDGAGWTSPDIPLTGLVFDPGVVADSAALRPLPDPLERAVRAAGRAMGRRLPDAVSTAERSGRQLASLIEPTFDRAGSTWFVQGGDADVPRPVALDPRVLDPDRVEATWRQSRDLGDRLMPDLARHPARGRS